MFSGLSLPCHPNTPTRCPHVWPLLTGGGCTWTEVLSGQRGVTLITEHKISDDQLTETLPTEPNRDAEICPNYPQLDTHPFLRAHTEGTTRLSGPFGRQPQFPCGCVTHTVDIHSGMGPAA